MILKIWNEIYIFPDFFINLHLQRMSLYLTWLVHGKYTGTPVLIMIICLLLSTSNFRFFFLTHLLTYETLWSWLVWYITFICIIIDVWGHESVAGHNRTILTTSEEGHLEHSQITGLRHVPMRRPGWLTYTNTKLSWWTIAPGYWLLLKQCDIIYVAITAWCHEDTAIKRGKQMWHGLVQRLGWLMYTNMKL